MAMQQNLRRAGPESEAFPLAVQILLEGGARFGHAKRLSLSFSAQQSGNVLAHRRQAARLAKENRPPGRRVRMKRAGRLAGHLTRAA
jgi:hypothetical protein